MKVIRPPQFEQFDRHLLYLAGPIKGAPNWQEQAVSIVHGLNPHILIASPRRNREIPGDLSDEEFGRQDRWCDYYVDLACKHGVCLVWLAKELNHDCERAYAQGSRLLLGQLMERHTRQSIRLIVGIESGFTGARDIRLRLSRYCPDIKVQDSLPAACGIAVAMLTNHFQPAYLSNGR